MEAGIIFISRLETTWNINEICIHVGNPHNLKTPVINWKTESLLLGMDTSTASKNAEWSR